jgi:hypothetical protein
MPRYDILLRRRAVDYRLVEGVDAETPEAAKRLAVRASRELDRNPDATLTDVGIKPNRDSNIGEWSHHADRQARLVVDSIRRTEV